MVAAALAFVNGANWDDKLALLKLAGPATREALRSAMLTHVRAAVSAGKCPYTDNEAGHLWDDTVAASYLALAGACDGGPRAELVTGLAKYDLDLVRPLLLDWLDRKSTRLNSSHLRLSRMPSSA